MQHRPYKSYEEYVEHQKIKRGKPGVVEGLIAVREERIAAFSEIFRRFLTKRFRKNCSSAICLGARLGEEVEALWRMKIKATGVDLFEYLPWVIIGDFNQKLPFDDNSFTLVFSNSVDHIYDLPSWSQEVNRLLRPGGQILVQLMLGRMGGFESIQVDSPQEIVALFPGYSVIADVPYAGPAYDRVLVLQKPLNNN